MDSPILGFLKAEKRIAEKLSSTALAAADAKYTKKNK